jgi:hypothetical protein
VGGGFGWGRCGFSGLGWGLGGEMNQALYAHMNNKRKMKKKINKMFPSLGKKKKKKKKKAFSTLS